MTRPRSVPDPGPRIISWEVEASGEPLLEGVWGVGANNLFAVGRGGAIRHYNGVEWSSMVSGTTESLYDVWGVDADNIFTVGANGTVLRYNGVLWTSIGPTDDVGPILSIHGTAADNVYIITVNRGLYHFDGSNWSAVNTGFTVSMSAVWTQGVNIFVAGTTGAMLRFDGTSWSSMTTPTSNTLRAITGSSLTNVVAVGYSGTMIRFDGTNWNDITTGTTQTLTDVALIPGGALAVGWGEVFLKSAFGGTEVIDIPGLGNANGLWLTSATTAFVVGDSWTHVVTAGNPINAMPMKTGITNEEFRCVWGSDTDNTYVVGDDGLVFRWDGSDWINVDIGTPWGIEAIWGTAPDDIYVAIFSDLFIHYDGIEWLPMAGVSLAEHPYAMSGHTNLSNSGTSLVVVGEAGSISMFDGTTWSEPTSPTNDDLNAVYVNSASDMFAVGSQGAIVHYDGAVWSEMTSNVTEGLYSVHGTASNNVYAVGASGTIIHFDGTAWSEDPGCHHRKSSRGVGVGSPGRGRGRRHRFALRWQQLERVTSHRASPPGNMGCGR